MAAHLQGKVAIVTGSGRGVGRAEALGLAAEGAQVVVNDAGVHPDGSGHSQSPADEVVAEIEKQGGKAVANYDSVADFRAAGRIIQCALDTFGRLDILVNNAGIFRDALFVETTEEEWDSQIAVHLKGTFNTCKHAVPVMVRQRYGRIINTTSGQWRHPEGRAAYAAAKGGVVSLTWDLAWELRNEGITVNAIAPGANTRAYDDSPRFNQRTLQAGLLTQARVEQMNREHRLAGAEPLYVAPMVVYLASELTAHVTGCIFRVTGGKIGLYTHPTETLSVFRNPEKDGPWPVEELKELLPRTLLAGRTKAPHIP